MTIESSDVGCDWTDEGFKGPAGPDVIAAGSGLSEYDCAKACRMKAKTNPEINGATIRTSDGLCACHVSLTEIIAMAGHKVCYLGNWNAHL